LDFSSVYDRVSHNYSFHILQIYGCSENFKDLIQSMYEDSYSRVHINEYRSGPFPSNVRFSHVASWARFRTLWLWVLYSSDRPNPRA